MSNLFTALKHKKLQVTNMDKCAQETNKLDIDQVKACAEPLHQLILASGNPYMHVIVSAEETVVLVDVLGLGYVEEERGGLVR